MKTNEEGQDGSDEAGEIPPFNPVFKYEQGKPFITLPDGSVIALHDWAYGSFYTAAVISPYGSDYNRLEPFSSGRSQQLIGGGPDERATTAHTNVPRSGDSGLPNGWEMFVFGWRAQCSLPLEQSVMDFAADCLVEFSYNAKMYRQCLLSELLIGGGSLASEPGEPSMPVHMRSQLSYGVSITPQTKAAYDNFRAYLRGQGAPNVDPTVIAELEQLARLAGGNIGGEITRIQKKLQPGKRATFWFGLEGYIKRTVV